MRPVLEIANMTSLINLFFSTPRRTLLWMAAVILGMLSFGMYLQYGLGLTPCPMCIVQRYAYIVVLILALLGAVAGGCRTALAAMGLILPVALFGAFTAARQSWLQWYPPEFYSCGRDFYGMIEQLPLSQALPRIFAGSGDCTAVDWTFLGGTIANWSFVGFAAIALVCLGWFWTILRRRR